jgi:anti-sigma B factor antagonist
MLSDKTDVDNMVMKFIVNRDGAVAWLYGRIDIDSSPAVRDRLLALLNAPHPNVINIDFSAVTHIDSSGVATLIEALRVARRLKTEMRLQGLDDRLLRLFELTGILSFFNGERPSASQPGKAV